MLHCHSCYINGTWKGKEVRWFKVMVGREAEGGSMIPHLSVRNAFLFRSLLV